MSASPHQNGLMLLQSRHASPSFVQPACSALWGIQLGWMGERISKINHCPFPCPFKNLLCLWLHSIWHVQNFGVISDLSVCMAVHTQAEPVLSVSILPWLLFLPPTARSPFSLPSALTSSLPHGSHLTFICSKGAVHFYTGHILIQNLWRLLRSVGHEVQGLFVCLLLFLSMGLIVISELTSSWFSDWLADHPLSCSLCFRQAGLLLFLNMH